MSNFSFKWDILYRLIPSGGIELFIRVEWHSKNWTIDMAGQPMAAFWYGH